MLSTRRARSRTLGSMQIVVALTPKLMRNPKRHAVAVVDVLRATTSIVALHENGLLRAIISENIQQARKLALSNFSLLCGEVKSRHQRGSTMGIRQPSSRRSPSRESRRLS